MGKRILKWAARVLGGAVVVVAALAAYVQLSGIPKYAHRAPELHVEVTPERVEHGKKLSRLLCQGCHFDPKTQALTGAKMTDLPPEFGTAVSKNITRHPIKGIGAWSDGDIAYLLRSGVRPDGQYVPPWMPKFPHTSDEEIASIIAFLRSDDPMVAPKDADPPGKSEPSFFAKALAHGVFGPLPYPDKPIAAPPRSDRVAYGRYLVYSLDCFGCHSADFKSVNEMEPDKSAGYLGGGNLLHRADGEIPSANITPDDETGIGKWSEADFVRALRRGFRPDGHVLNYPMEPRPDLDDEEAGAIYAYLRTVPKIHNAVKRAAPPAESGDDGQRVYARYGCVSCHGDRGVGLGGLADLRRANQDFKTDTELRAWIDDAPKLRPGTRMPGWRGVIREEDYPALMRHVRKLSSDEREATNR